MTSEERCEQLQKETEAMLFRKGQKIQVRDWDNEKWQEGYFLGYFPESNHSVIVTEDENFQSPPIGWRQWRKNNIT